MDLSVITVTWNSRKMIDTCIKSVQAGANNIVSEHIIVDNSSADDTVKHVQTAFPEITLIQNSENAGFGAANNQGYAKSTGEFLLFLNPDMQIHAGTLDTVIEWMRKRPSVGIAGCTLTDADGNIDIATKPRRFPTLLNQLAVLFKLPHLIPSLLNSYLYNDIDMTREQTVDSVRGSFFLVRRKLIEEVGFAFDPRYYIWFEEVDMCKHAKKHGYEVMYTPIIQAIDYYGKSFEKQNNFWKAKQFSRSMLTYFQKWHPWYRWIWIWLTRPLALAMTWVYIGLAND